VASLFVIREKNTGTFCTSSKFKHFEADLQKAAMFNQRKNAESAARKMFAGANKGTVNPYGGWAWRVYNEDGTEQTYHHALLKEYIELLKTKQRDDDEYWSDTIQHLQTKVREQPCEMEVVEVRLTLV
jgi:hypothetical protein